MNGSMSPPRPFRRSDLVAASKVLDHLVGLQNVRPDLAPESDLLGLTADRRQLVFSLLALEVEKASRKHLHASVLVLVLAALVLARHHDARSAGG